MAITQKVRDRLLIEARHRCTICAEPAYELHHLIEQSQGGDDSEENLIVLCPNCHQQRVHRNKELSLAQLRAYKLILKEKNEVERRLLLNLEAIVQRIEELGLAQAEVEVMKELSESAAQLDQTTSPTVFATVEQTARWLAERGTLKAGARRALEIECDLDIQRELAKWGMYAITSVDEDAWTKANDFPTAYKFVVKLNGTPYSQWCEIFDNEYRNSLYMMKRKSRVVGDKLEMIVADSDNLQNHVDFLKQLVESSNSRIRDHIERTLNPHLLREKGRVLAELDSVENLKSKTKGLVI
jgi:hypothetical protein